MGTKSGKLGNMPSMPRAKAAQACECGCGGATKGGRFIPGHDARRLGWAIRIHRGFDVTGITPGELAAAKAFIKSEPSKFVGPGAGAARVRKPKDGRKPAPKPEPQPAEVEGPKAAAV